MKCAICGKEINGGFLVERECLVELKKDLKRQTDINNKLKEWNAELKKIIRADLKKIEELVLRTANPATAEKLYTLANTKRLSLDIDPLKWERTLTIDGKTFKGNTLDELINYAYKLKCPKCGNMNTSVDPQEDHLAIYCHLCGEEFVWEETELTPAEKLEWLVENTRFVHNNVMKYIEVTTHLGKKRYSYGEPRRDYYNFTHAINAAYWTEPAPKRFCQDCMRENCIQTFKDWGKEKKCRYFLGTKGIKLKPKVIDKGDYYLVNETYEIWKYGTVYNTKGGDSPQQIYDLRDELLG